MALQRQMCVNHPQRPAAGVCVITRQPICGECSTRYEGVNYSKEGLEILRQRRAQESARLRRRGRWLPWLLAPLSPLLVWLVFLVYQSSFMLLIDLQQKDILKLSQ